MRLFRDLSVGRKLAMSAGVALLLLGGLVTLVTLENVNVATEQAAERRAAEARLAAFDAGRLLLDANNALRGVLLANQPERRGGAPDGDTKRAGAGAWPGEQRRHHPA